MSLSSDNGEQRRVRIGCSSGFWGDTATSVPQLIYGGNIQVRSIRSACCSSVTMMCPVHYSTLQYLVSDYLSEITMSLLAAVRNKRPELGFCPDFLESTAPHLAEIKRRGIRVVTNGGDKDYGIIESLRRA